MDKETNGFHLLTVFLLSVVLVALQLLLMRALSVSSYYHFSYLVISTALLGFGVSGTFLTFLYDKLAKHFSNWSLFFLLLFLVSIPVSYLAAETLPIDIQYVLFSTEQQLWLMLYNILIFIPFFLGAVVIGFYLSYFQQNAPVIYGFNLFGSGAGALIALWFMFQFPAYQLPVKITIVAALAIVTQLLSDREYFFGKRRSIGILSIIASLGIGISMIFFQPDTKVDPYKSYYHLEQLKEQGDAQKISTQYGPRAQIDIYQSDKIHQTLFAGLQATDLPPPQMSLLIDGESAGSIFKIDSVEQASIMASTPQSVPYRLFEAPKVLLLGETTGNNIWLAKQFGAIKITVVQNNPQIIDLMTGELADSSGGIYLQPEVEIVDLKPRLFLKRNHKKYDIIQLVSGESMASGTQGLQSLNENFLLTVEGIREAFLDLTDDGLITITRGIQTPPRDNIKLFALFAEALKNEGVAYPSNHLLQARNYLAMNTILAKRGIDDERLQRYLEAGRQQLMDFEHYPGIQSDTLTQTNKISGPEGENYSYFHHAVKQILGESPDLLLNSWIYDVEPPTDNRPYFNDYFKWSSIDRIIEVYGKNWFQRLELGYVVLAVTFAEVSLIAFLLILLPLFFMRQKLSNLENKLPTFIHFGAIGVGFMFLEMVFIQQFTNFMGDPIYSVAVVMTAILVFSGVGSSIQKKLPWPPISRIRYAGLSVMAIAILFLFLLDPILSLFVGYSLWTRFVVTLVLLFPLTFMLGWMFVSGIGVLESRSPKLVPWAWGINGFASVIAAPLAVMLSMSVGFKMVVLMAAGCYGVAVLNNRLWR
ncbi:hypothetical protein [Rhodohalobacter sulfatireducens]|uniref:Uncharacterized protein n=1 Tax=Rhodohalobacter sulfatireducens TaxID=2911366 RepID=A0ABS9KHY3_9BACT|nr:hypothetical protein [Rhodohalobacter sulfatireducens]MCG2590458.1 hypothetical protein [Rhodohalobacter sulfatireducens]